jgi:hypothetical protein
VKLVADENVDRQIVDILRASGSSLSLNWIPASTTTPCSRGVCKPVLFF